MPSEYRRYNLTLTVVDQSQRDKFRKLSRPDTFFEIRPNREVGERGAYSVEMTEEEYREALKDAESSFSNLIAIESVQRGQRHFSSSIPGDAATQYMAADQAPTLGLSGSGVDVGLLDSGVSAAVQGNQLAGRIKASRAWGMFEGSAYKPDDDVEGHGTEMVGLAVPPEARVVIAAAELTDDFSAAAIYWMVDEVGIDVLSMSLGWPDYTTVFEDAINHAGSKNILMFASLGNGGYDNTGPGQQINDLFPASSPHVQGISNYRPSTDSIASNSNYGSTCWAAVAGSEVYLYNLAGSAEYADNGGTSAACAFASGIAASFLSGSVSPGNVKSYLESTARRTGASPIYEGNGVLQLAAAWNALQDAQAPPTNTDGSIPLPNGGRVQLPSGSGTYTSPELPADTTVYPTGAADFSTTPGSFILPDGGSAQLADGTTAPSGWPATGTLPLSRNSQVDGSIPDGQASGYCPDSTCPDGSTPPGGGGSGAGGSTGRQYAMLFENFDMTNPAWQAIEACLAIIWTLQEDVGLFSEANLDGYDLADLAALPGDCVETLFTTAGWYALDADGNPLPEGVPPESGVDTIWPPESWRQ